MITPSYAPTATERVLPRLALDFTTASLDARVTVTRALDTATRVNSSGLIEIVNANLPRFDYTLNTGGACKGLLIEEARTNLIVGSSGSGGTKIGTATVTLNNATSPDGTTNATLLSGIAVGAANGIRFRVSGTGAGNFTSSIYIKGTANSIGKDMRYYFEGNGGAYQDFGTRDVTLTGSWQRVDITGNSNGTSTFLDFVCSRGGSAQADEYYIWGAQMEAGAFATSYIPTTTTSLTRNADVVQMTGTNFSSWFNASAGTLMVSATGYNAATVAQGGTAPTAVSLYAAAAVNPYATIAISRRDNATLNSPSGFILSDTGSLGADIQKNTVSWVGATVNAAIAWNGSTDAAFTANGLTVGTDTSYTLPTSDSLQIGRWGSETISGYWSGHVRRVSFYPQRLTNAELQAITK